MRPGADRQADDWADVDRAIAAAEADAQRLGPHYRQVLLPDGALVVASFVDVELGNIGGAVRWLAHFEIVESPSAPECVGFPILRAYNAPRPGWQSPQAALSRDFAAVTGLRPRPIAKLAPRAILGAWLRDVWVEARTRVVRRRMDRETRRWVETPEAEWYSVVDRIVRRVGGCPRILQKRTSPQKS